MKSCQGFLGFQSFVGRTVVLTQLRNFPSNSQIAKPRKSPIIGKEKNRYSRDESMSLPPSAPENGIEVTMLLGPSLTQSYGSRIAPGDGVVAEDGNIPGTDQAGSNEDILRTARPTMCAPPDSPQRRFVFRYADRIKDGENSSRKCSTKL